MGIYRSAVCLCWPALWRWYSSWESHWEITRTRTRMTVGSVKYLQLLSIQQLCNADLHMSGLHAFQTREWCIWTSDFYNSLAHHANGFNLKFLSLLLQNFGTVKLLYDEQHGGQVNMVTEDKWLQIAGKHKFELVDSSCDYFHVCACFPVCLPVSVVHKALAPSSNFYPLPPSALGIVIGHCVPLSVPNYITALTL